MTVLAINGQRHDVDAAADLLSLNDYIRLHTRFKVRRLLMTDLLQPQPAGVRVGFPNSDRPATPESSIQSSPRVPCEKPELFDF